MAQERGARDNAMFSRGSIRSAVDYINSLRDLNLKVYLMGERCVGMDAFSGLHSITFDLDRKHDAAYHDRFWGFLSRLQGSNLTGSSQARRIQVSRSMQVEFKKVLAKTLAGISSALCVEIADDLSSSMTRMLASVRNQ